MSGKVLHEWETDLGRFSIFEPSEGTFQLLRDGDPVPVRGYPSVLFIHVYVLAKFVAELECDRDNEADRAARYSDRAVKAENALALAETARDSWRAAFGQRQDELNEAHRALAWVCKSLPFEDSGLPAHLAPPDFVARQMRIAKAVASTLAGGAA